MRKTLLLLASAAGLAACASPQAEQAIQAQTALVGIGKADLLSCAGVPHRTAQLGDVEQLQYRRTEVVIDRQVDVDESFASRILRERRGGVGPRFYEREVREWRIPYTCEATFTLRNGVVERVTYNDNRSIQQCYEIVGNCVR